MNIRTAEYCLSRCYNPIKVRAYNPVTNQYETREVPCGKCDHCRMTNRNEWTTRMYLESMYHDYIYFVTFTYDKKYLIGNEDVLQETHATSTNINSYNRYEITPIVLCKEHTQKMWKRLRKMLPKGSKISYVIVGEYGHKYGRPHYHAIVYSDIPLTQQHFETAWSINNKPIGNVDYVDMSSKQDEDFKHSFGYVTKYILKEFDFNTIPTKKQHIKIQKDEDISKNSKEITRSYSKIYGPFMLCSRKLAIGERYLQENIERFKKGNFDLHGLPSEMRSNFIFPRYFLRKTKEALCPCKTITAQGKVCSTSNYIDKVVEYATSLQYDTQDVYKMLSSQQLPSQIAQISPKSGYGISELSFYNGIDCTWNFLVGDKYMAYGYDRHKRTYVIKYTKPMETVINWLQTKYSDYLKLYRELYSQRLSREIDFRQDVIAEYFEDEDCELSSEDMVYQACYTRWREDADVIRNNNKLCNNFKQDKYKDTKNKF